MLTFLMKIFSICHWCQQHWWHTLSCEYLCEFSKKIRKGPSGILRGLGESRFTVPLSFFQTLMWVRGFQRRVWNMWTLRGLLLIILGSRSNWFLSLFFIPISQQAQLFLTLGKYHNLIWTLPSLYIGIRPWFTRNKANRGVVKEMTFLLVLI